MHRVDEQLPLYVVFRTPLFDDGTLKAYLARLAIDLQGFAFSTAPQPEAESKSGNTKELIHSSTIKDTDTPLILRHGKGDDTITFIIWKVDVFVSRPQGRLHKPAVYFQPTASFKPAASPAKADSDDEYLPSNTPMSINLLQAFENDPAFAGVQPRLSAKRISKIAPSASPITRELIRPIRNGQRPLFKILPALVWRMRYSRVQTSLNDLSLLASLDLEVASYHPYDVRIEQVDLTLTGGTIIPFELTLDPQALHKAGDIITYLYKITPTVSPEGTPLLGSKGHILSLHITATLLLASYCTPNISIDWKTPVDFTTVLDQSPSLLKAAHRLSNPSSTIVSKPTNPDALPSHDTQSQTTTTNEPNTAINITITISGPPRVTVGQHFTWSVFIINRSSVARKLAILVIPKRKSPYNVQQHTSRPSTASNTATITAPNNDPANNPFPSSGSNAKDLLAPAILDENILYATQKAARVDDTELICLTTDIRLGQLAPGSCYMADLKFLPLREGVLGVESVRVIDLATNETADVRDLPSVVAYGAEDGGEDEEG